MTRRMLLVAILSWTTVKTADSATLFGLGFDSPDGYFATAIDHVPGLAAVDFRFTNGEHNINHIEVGHLSPTDPTQFRLAFHDSNLDDPVRFDVRWFDLRPYGAERRVSATCRRECRLSIPPIPAGDAFVLTGFDFSFPRNLGSWTDHLIREIELQPHGPEGFIDTAFNDGGDNDYRVIVRYTVLPASAVAVQSFAGSRWSVGSALATRVAGQAMIQGFRFAFYGGAHRLERFAVDLRGTSSVAVQLRDGNADDAFTWSVDYVVLRAGL